MVSRDEWVRKAEAVGKFGSGAATSEKGAYKGMPLLKQALDCFFNFDNEHRKAIADIVNKWANREDTGLESLVFDMKVIANSRSYFHSDIKEKYQKGKEESGKNE